MDISGAISFESLFSDSLLLRLKAEIHPCLSSPHNSTQSLILRHSRNYFQAWLPNALSVTRWRAESPKVDTLAARTWTSLGYTSQAHQLAAHRMATSVLAILRVASYKKPGRNREQNATEARGSRCTRQFQGVYWSEHDTLKTSREPAQDYIAARSI